MRFWKRMLLHCAVLYFKGMPNKYTASNIPPHPLSKTCFQCSTTSSTYYLVSPCLISICYIKEESLENGHLIDMKCDRVRTCWTMLLQSFSHANVTNGEPTLSLHSHDVLLSVFTELEPLAEGLFCPPLPLSCLCRRSKPLLPWDPNSAVAAALL